MAKQQPLRDILAALAMAVATAIGIVTLTPMPWPVAALSATCMATLALLVDIHAFDRPVDRISRAGRRAVIALSAAAIVTGLVLSFVVGRETTDEPSRYPFVVTNASGAFSFVKSVPVETAQTDRSLDIGDTVWIDCIVKQKDELWYRLSDLQGWLHEDELLASPYTGMGHPPQCPN